MRQLLGFCQNSLSWTIASQMKANRNLPFASSLSLSTDSYITIRPSNRRALHIHFLYNPRAYSSSFPLSGFLIPVELPVLTSLSHTSFILVNGNTRRFASRLSNNNNKKEFLNFSCWQHAVGRLSLFSLRKWKKTQKQFYSILGLLGDFFFF